MITPGDILFFLSVDQTKIQIIFIILIYVQYKDFTSFILTKTNL